MTRVFSITWRTDSQTYDHAQVRALWNRLVLPDYTILIQHSDSGLFIPSSDSFN